jgi:hypothetical protein
MIDAMDDGRPMPSEAPAVGVSPVPPVNQAMGSGSPEAAVDQPMGSGSPEAAVDQAMGSGSPEAAVDQAMGSGSPEAAVDQAMGSGSPEAAVDQPVGPAPVVRTIAINCSRAHAYATFTARIGEWWPRAFSASGPDLADVVIEPHVGGRVYEISKNGDEFTWGAVKAIQDGTAITIVWTLGVHAPDPTEVDLRFAGDITGDLADGDLVADVTLRHSGFVSADDQGRFDSDDGWSEVLAAYIACAEA